MLQTHSPQLEWVMKRGLLGPKRIARQRGELGRKCMWRTGVDEWRAGAKGAGCGWRMHGLKPQRNYNLIMHRGT